MSDVGLVIGQGLVIQPGDTLILVFSRPVGQELAGHIKQTIAERFPDISVAVLDNVDQVAVYRPEG